MEAKFTGLSHNFCVNMVCGVVGAGKNLRLSKAQLMSWFNVYHSWLYTVQFTESKISLHGLIRAVIEWFLICFNS